MVRRIPNIFLKKCLRNEKTHKNLRGKKIQMHILEFLKILKLIKNV